MAISPHLIDELLRDLQGQDGLLGKDELIQQLADALDERTRDTSLAQPPNANKRGTKGKDNGANRNGTPPEAKQGNSGRPQPEVSQGRNDSAGSQKDQTLRGGVDETITSLYAHGMSERQIQEHLREVYHVDVSTSFISNVTDAILEEVHEWQSRPLDAVYPIVYLDALMVSVRSHGRVVSKAVCVALGINLLGRKEVLGLWATESEGAKFWMQVVTEMKNRGLKDIFIACMDDLRGFPEAVRSVYPQTQVQLCVVHQVRSSLRWVPHKTRKEVATELKPIYQAATLEEAERQLTWFEEKWRPSYPIIARSWRDKWAELAPMFGYPPEVRRAIYTTNAIESLNMSLRHVSKNRSLFPSDDAVFKLMYLALRNISKRWTMPIHNWGSAINQFAIIFEGRILLDWRSV